jgi:DNA-binding response OmpR family regulator
MVLGEIRRIPSFDQVPVVILTGSKSDSDAKLARDLKADLYIIKPPDVSHFPVFVNSLDHLLTSRLKKGDFPILGSPG